MSTAQALEEMFTVAPVEWWAFVPCRGCNAGRQEPCQAPFGLANHPHASRVRSAGVLHGTLWLLTNGFAGDVLGQEGVSEAAQGGSGAVATPRMAPCATEAVRNAHRAGKAGRG